MKNEKYFLKANRFENIFCFLKKTQNFEKIKFFFSTVRQKSPGVILKKKSRKNNSCQSNIALKKYFNLSKKMVDFGKFP